ncbi:condensation domain-containing protein [Micromonospora sp. M12]
MRRHANLRACIRHLDSAQPVQAILSEVDVPWTELDLGGLPPQEAGAELDRLLEQDRYARFDLSTAPLIRCTLVRIGPDLHRFMFTNHHMLLDGWSTPLVLDEIFTLYARDGETAGCGPSRRTATIWRGSRPRTPRRRRRRGARRWTASTARRGWFRPAAQASWHYPVAAWSTCPRRSPGGSPARRQRAGDGRHGRADHVGIALGGLTGSQDVIFGVTVSGRPAELPGVETMVGLFLNTLPMRVHTNPGERLIDVVKRVQREQNHLRPHQHLGLSTIQRLVGEGELFDVISVFENVPMEGARRHWRRPAWRRGPWTAPTTATTRWNWSRCPAGVCTYASPIRPRSSTSPLWTGCWRAWSGCWRPSLLSPARFSAGSTWSRPTSADGCWRPGTTQPGRCPTAPSSSSSRRAPRPTRPPSRCAAAARP